jgi:hypothetical protein
MDNFTFLYLFKVAWTFLYMKRIKSYNTQKQIYGTSEVDLEEKIKFSLDVKILLEVVHSDKTAISFNCIGDCRP